MLEEEVLPFMTEGDNEETHNDDGQTRTLHIETLRDICTEVSIVWYGNGRLTTQRPLGGLASCL